MKFEEPTSNTDISGKTKMIRLYRKKYNITHFENTFVFKGVLCSHLKSHDYNDYTTSLSDMLPIDFDMVRILN